MADRELPPHNTTTADGIEDLAECQAPREQRGQEKHALVGEDTRRFGCAPIGRRDR